jgi:hypothetical protein
MDILRGFSSSSTTRWIDGVLAQIEIASSFG